MNSYDALIRLKEEHRLWKKNKIVGFAAAPTKDHAGLPNMYVWMVGMPGRQNTIFEGSYLRFEMTFSLNYPLEPPTVRLHECLIIHPNFNPDEDFMLYAPFLAEEWHPALRIKDILVRIHEILHKPNLNFDHIVNDFAVVLLSENPLSYASSNKGYFKEYMQTAPKPGLLEDDY